MPKLSRPSILPRPAPGLACLLSAFFLLPVGASAAEIEQEMAIGMESHKGYFREQCLELSPGQGLGYRFTTPVPVEFNLHYHPEGGGMEYVDHRQVADAHEGFLAPVKAGGVYCFMWTNRESSDAGYDIDLDYRVVDD